MTYGSLEITQYKYKYKYKHKHKHKCKYIFANKTLRDSMLADDIWELWNHKQPTINFPPRDKQLINKMAMWEICSFSLPTLFSFISDFWLRLHYTGTKKKGHIKVSFHKCNPLRTYQLNQRRATWFFFWNSHTPKDVQKNYLKNTQDERFPKQDFFCNTFRSQIPETNQFWITSGSKDF